MLDTRVALITGCGKPNGMGQAIARRLASEGCAVIVTDRDPSGVPNVGEPVRGDAPGLDALVDELTAAGGRAVGLVADIGSAEQVDEVFARVDADFGRLDVLVNNAAAPQGPDRVDIGEVSAAAWDELIRVNLTGTFLMSRAAVALMRRAQYGRIVNISSMAALTAAPRSVAYSASKAGILGLTRSLAMDVARWGITVNAICPGLVGTSRAMLGSPGMDRDEAMARWAQRIAVGRVGAPDDIANAVAFFADPRSAHITGQALPLDGGGGTGFTLSEPLRAG